MDSHDQYMCVCIKTQKSILFYHSKELITKSPFPYFVLVKLLPVRLTHHKRLFFRYKYEMISL